MVSRRRAIGEQESIRTLEMFMTSNQYNLHRESEIKDEEEDSSF